MSRFIYADNAATTAVSQPVLDAMLPYFAEHYGNPSSIYSIGRDAHTAVDTAREQTAAALGALPEEIYFTSGGSEADNWAIRGAALANRKKGRHIISSVFEHHAVLHTLKALEKEGWEVTYLKVYENGIVRPDDLRAAIRPDTVLVTIMYANNEIGTIQPIPELAGICHEKGVLFHTDAVQAIGHVAINVKEQGIDMLSLSAHKFHGPKGTGALYIKKGLRIPNLIEGGAQERGHRAGTENVAGIVGLGRAIEIACKDITARDEKVKLLRDALIDNLLKIKRVRLNGDRLQRLAGNVNVSVEGIEGESLLLMLDMKGVCASSGSACTSGSLDPSHVLLAIGLPHEVAHGSLRLTLGEENTMADVNYICEVLPSIIDRLRSMSPVWEKIEAQA
ncbi:MAG: cysteine desulfurase NifS [Clostridia bacterium]|nr:cysteine desulfurase NifS [Clostridia bacterium]